MIIKYKEKLTFIKLENLHFPSEYSDTNAGKQENECLKEKLFKKHLARPPSKRVNFLKHGILSPFSGPYDSIMKLHSSSSQDETFFILRNRQLLNKISNLFFNKNKQIKANELSAHEIELLGKCFINVRLESTGKGNMENFSLIYHYSDKKEIQQSDQAKAIIGDLINKYKHDEIKAICESNKKGITKPTLNRLLKSKFNKQNLLIQEKRFEIYQTQLQKLKDNQTAIGFISKSNFRLASGKYNANGFILGKSFVEIIQKSENNLVNYITPSCQTFFKTAKISNLYFK